MSVLNAMHFHDEAAAFEMVESVIWPNGPVCPHCGEAKRVYALNGVRSKASKKYPEGVVRHGLKKCGACRSRRSRRQRRSRTGPRLLGTKATSAANACGHLCIESDLCRFSAKS